MIYHLRDFLFWAAGTDVIVVSTSDSPPNVCA